ncbi:MAG: NAD(+) diphosphatase [Bacillota bacterium]|nr:NAD(+) diphosphatase [Bacillota bacterium]
MRLKMSVSLDSGADNGHALVFAYREDQILVIDNGEVCRIPERIELEKMNLNIVRRHFLGTLDGQSCYSVDLDTASSAVGGSSFIGLRELFGKVDDEIFSLAVHANQVINWDRMHQYCGKCGARTEYAPDERAKICKCCDAVYYPRISPAVIVAIKKGRELLLLRNKRYKHEFYSVLAGFVEPGESLEECLVREVKEEAGIEVKNIKYYGSQSWPFPNSLMVGFTADYAGGELRLDEIEIADAGWFTPENFPNLPGPISIARRLIDSFVDEQNR